MARPHHRSQKRTPAQSREVQLVVEKPIYGGNFLARVDGKAHFVPFAVPGEEVVAKIIEEKKSFARCEPVHIAASSAERIALRCPHFTRCGGCDYQHVGYETQIHWKLAILEETFTRAGIALPGAIEPLTADPWHYRNRIRLAVDVNGKLGYRERNSHRVIAITECPIAEPRLIVAAREFELALPRLATIGVEEIEFFAAPKDTNILARIQARAPQKGWLKDLAPLAPSITGAELFTSDESRAIDQFGADALSYEVDGISYRVANGAFFQVNQNLLSEFCAHVLSRTGGTSGDLAWDLYCGVGLFAKRLAMQFKKVVAVESAPLALDSLEANLAGCNAKIIQSTTEAFLLRAAATDKPDLILVDPPRAGLGEEVAERLYQIQAQKVIYVSCDPATMARDLKLFTNYNLTLLAMADLFPQTFHLESIAVLELK
jgi:23S rRNA (uracil1939-C5)-methyltransferase